MYAKRSNVSSGFTRNPKDTKMTIIIEFNQFKIMNGTDTQLTFYGWNKWWSLEKSTGKSFKGLGEFLFRFNSIVETDYTYIFLTFWKIIFINFCFEFYFLPAPCWDLTSLVARSTHTIKQPVTLGSKVPEWPVFSTLRILLIHATTSCEDGLAGLSRLITPYLT